MLKAIPRVEIDPELPASLGDESLRLPVQEEVLGLCVEHLGLDQAVAASCCFARCSEDCELSNESPQHPPSPTMNSNHPYHVTPVILTEQSLSAIIAPKH